MENTPVQEKKPLINCHTHIFKGEHVPPWLAKTFLPWPLYYLLPVSGVVAIFRWWYKGPYRWQFQSWYKRIARFLYKVKMFIARNFIINLVVMIAGILLTIQVFFILYDFISGIIRPESKETGWVEKFREWLENYNLLLPLTNTWLNILMGIILILFFKSGRNLILFLFKRFWKFLGMLPGKQSKALLKRYINLGRFAFHEGQGSTFGQLKRQYPPGSGFIILPMDMEFMGAGKVGESYRDQMEDLARLKKINMDIFHPFVFADPRRIEKEQDYFRYTVDNNGNVILEECFIKTFMEQHQFRGFKIYPALGYYVFDEKLLPLWKYACENEIPILTHCIRGNIYYRGSKKKEWDTHPVFEQSKKEGEYEPLFLPEKKNIEFINNFTHPLNYLCLLDETLLRKIVMKAGALIKSLFGYIDEKTPLKYNLEKLKLCFGHYGGEDEWQRFFEKDRDNLSSQLIKNPAKGISFLKDEDGNPTPGKPEQVWKFADWYSITSSMMLQYDNVYSDISFILHTPQILPLLKQTMQNPKLSTRTLYGTDFYVVRNYKSDKNMLADMILVLTETEFDLLARENPRQFLTNKIHGPLNI